MGKVVWSAKHDNIYKQNQKVYNLLVLDPVLKIFDPSLSMELHIDASSEVYWVVLIQKEKQVSM